MTDRPATPAQAALLASANAGRVTIRARRPGAAAAFYADDRPVTAAGARLDARGWITYPTPLSGVGDVTLTPAGKRALTEALDLAKYEAAVRDGTVRRLRAQVERRPTLRRPPAGQGGVGYGRNVVCYACHAAAKERGERANPIVWYTNDGGAAAQRAADAALRAHVLAHLRGTLP